MKHIVTITLSFCMVLRTINCEKLNGVTVTNCYLEEMKLHDPTSYAFVRVNGTYTEKHVLDEDTVYCEILGEDKPRTHIVALEKVFFGDAPQLLSFQVADVFASELEGNVISCDFRKIAFHKEENAAASRSKFICEDLRSLGVIFIGLGSKPFTASGSGNRDRRRIKREINYSNIECSKGDAGKHKNRPIVGQPCNITDDEYQYKIGRVWQINSDDASVCLPCCVNHHWDNITKQCMPCKPGTVQPLPNFWSTCEPQRSTPTEPPATVSTSNGQNSVTPQTSMPTPRTTKPRMKPPIQVPNGLVVTKVGQRYALIEWTATVSLPNMQVRNYWVEYHEFGSNRSGTYNVKGKKTWVRLEGLNPGSCYEVTVAAGNPAGRGPRSSSISVHTQRALSDLKNLRKGNDAFEFAWNAKPEDHDLTVKAEIWALGDEPGTMWTFSKRNCNGKIKIPFQPSLPGNYSVRLFYATDGQDGPKSEMKTIECKGSKCQLSRLVEKPGVNGLCIAGVVLLVAVVVLLLICLFKSKISTCLSNHRHYHPGQANQD